MNLPVCESNRRDAGLEGLGPEDVRLPLLKLKQRSMLDWPQVPEGSWFLTSEPDCHSLSRGLVLLEVKKQRGLFLPWEDGEPRERVVARIAAKTGVQVALDHDGAVCWSRDRVQPVTDRGNTPLSEGCATCPMAAWRTEEGRRVQDCGESYRLLFWDTGADSPCVYYARGAAIPPVKDLLTNIRVAGRRFDLPACGFLLGLATRRAHSIAGRYWIPAFSRPYTHTDPEAWVRYHEIHDAVRAAS